MSKRDYHVVPHKNGWAVRREEAERVSSRHDTQAQALQAGRQYAQDQGTELVIHRPNGQKRDSNSYGRGSDTPM
jgi:hypothetical protein